MGASSEKSRCREAARYYYDLHNHDEAVVPEKIRQHVAGCRVCQARMRRLAESLGAGDAAGPEDRATVETLSLHLDLVNQPVTCGDVKPFLPGLETPAPEIRIPTPVTVHVDRCPSCAADLAALRALALPAEQLARLGRLYGAAEVRDDSACRQAEVGVASLASLSFTAVPAEILDHISLCASCRAEVYRQRRWRAAT
jgi:hypothetical protein